MTDFPIQQIFLTAYERFCLNTSVLSSVQQRAAQDILRCRSASLGHHVSICEDCGHTQIHYNSCKNRNCPNCQAVKKELWVDKRRAEVIDAPYFHVVFTLPHELNPLLYCNQKLLYGLFHKCCAQTLLELSRNPRFLGATPGIVQVLHTWNQELLYHVHMHCIVSGGGLTSDKRIRISKKHFFIPVRVLRDKFQGKFLALLEETYQQGNLIFPSSCEHLKNDGGWKRFRQSLYEKEWCPYIKETFNGFGNAIEYLGKYTHKIAISNSRILSVTEDQVIFSARGKKPGEPRRTIALSNVEFIRRFLLHVLPSGFQKMRYYGFLNNRMKTTNLKLIFSLQGHQRFKARYLGMSMAELLQQIWNIDIHRCPVCGGCRMRGYGKVYGSS